MTAEELQKARTSLGKDRWQASTDHGWEDFEEKLQLQIEHATFVGQTVEYAWAPHRYVIDPVEMTQFNIKTRKTRVIRKAKNKADEPLQAMASAAGAAGGDGSAGFAA